MDCSIHGCTNATRTNGYCLAHYKRWLKYGDPLAGARFKRPAGLTEAETFAWFMPGEPPVEGCWDWTAGTNNYGYGQFSRAIDGKPTLVLAHRAAYRIYCGPIPDDASILHSCDRPICCQPDHLRIGTRADNIQDAVTRDRHQHGETHSNAKLTAAQVRWIRRSNLSDRELADRFGVVRQTINDIRRCRNWKHLQQ